MGLFLFYSWKKNSRAACFFYFPALRSCFPPSSLGNNFSSLWIFWAKRRPRYKRVGRSKGGVGRSYSLFFFCSHSWLPMPFSFSWSYHFFFLSTHCMIPLCSPSCLLIVYIIFEPLSLTKKSIDAYLYTLCSHVILRIHKSPLLARQKFRLECTKVLGDNPLRFTASTVCFACHINYRQRNGWRMLEQCALWTLLA